MWSLVRFLSGGRRRQRSKVSEVWSADAEQRAAAFGWYWMAHPRVRDRINVLISGRADCDAYGRLAELLRERGVTVPIPCSASLGCGFGALERDLAARGMIAQMDAYDIADGAIAEARRQAQEKGLSNVRYHVADLDQEALPRGRFDVIFAHQSVHHVENLEKLCVTVSRALRPAGLFHLHEFVGPTRFQWTGNQLDLVNAWLDSLPERLRSLPSGEPKPPVTRPTVEAMIEADPSEAIRSSDIMRVVRDHFDVVEERPIGGALLHLGLGDIAQNFRCDDDGDRAALDRFFAMEDEAMADGRVASDFIIVTAARRA